MNMSDVIQNLFRDSIDIDAVMETIREGSVRSFRNLYDIQRSMTGMIKYDVPLTEFKRIYKLPKEKQKSQYPYRYIYTTGIDIVTSGNEFRFKASGLQNSALSIMDISQHPELFKTNFLVFVNGQLVPTVKFIVTENETTVMFELDKGVTPNDYMSGVSIDTFNNWVNAEDIATIIAVPNYVVDYVDVNKPTLDMNSGIIDTSSFAYATDFKVGETYFFMNTDTEDALSSFVRCNLINNKVEIPQSLYQNCGTNIFRIYGFNFNLLYNVKVMDSQSDWFMLSDEYELPVPKENMIVFVKDTFGYHYQDNITIDQYYPNVYHINGLLPNSDYIVFIFYADDTLDSKYINDLYILRMAYDDLVDRYKTMSLPDIVYEYEPVRVDLFDNDDFESSAFFPDKRHIYNIDRLNDYIQQDPKLLVEYLYHKLVDNQKYFISAAKLDLPTRIRTNSNSECIDIGNKISFNEDMYLINLRKQFVGTDSYEFRVFIDNLCVKPTEYTLLTNKDFYLFYIPTKYIKPDSIIEIEKYLEFRMTQPLYVMDITSQQPLSQNAIDVVDMLTNKGIAINTCPIKVSLPKNVSKFDSYCINVIREDYSFVDKEIYKIAIYNDIVEQFIEISPEGHYVIDRDYYIILDDSFIGTTLSLIVNTTSSFYNYSIPDYSVTMHDISVLSEPRLQSTNMRVYKNGHTLPKNRYYVTCHEFSNKPADVVLGCDVEPGDTIDYETLPIEFIPEYSQDVIDEKGYVDTQDYLSSPFDLKWYDVYLNGKKLNKTQIDVISCSRFFIKNVDSRKHLHVVKRNAIQDSFSINVENDIRNNLIDIMQDLLPNLKKDRDIIGDTAEDIIGDDAPSIFSHIMFVTTYLEFIFIDPNKKQLNSIIKSEFPNLFNEYDILTLETNVNPDAEYITSINSNIRRQYMKKGQYRYSFTPLHIGNHHDAMNGEYMCDPNTGLPGMKTASGEIMSSGLLNKLSNHKDRLNTKLVFNGMSNSSIYQVEFDSNTTGTREVVVGQNLLDGDIDMVVPANRFMISLDIDVLEKNDADIMVLSKFDPTIEIQYTVDTVPTVYTSKLSALSESPIKVSGSDIIISSVIVQMDSLIPSTFKGILYSILVAF